MHITKVKMFYKWPGMGMAFKLHREKKSKPIDSKNESLQHFMPLQFVPDY